MSKALILENLEESSIYVSYLPESNHDVLPVLFPLNWNHWISFREHLQEKNIRKKPGFHEHKRIQWTGSIQSNEVVGSRALPSMGAEGGAMAMPAMPPAVPKRIQKDQRTYTDRDRERESLLMFLCVLHISLFGMWIMLNFLGVDVDGIKSRRARPTATPMSWRFHSAGEPSCLTSEEVGEQFSRSWLGINWE